jgi:hypothetical protein
MPDDTPDPYLWTSAVAWATTHAESTAAVIHSIRQGTLPGEYLDGSWYVARPTVTLHYPNPADFHRAELRLLALQMGEYLTAARRDLVLPLTADDPDFDESLRFLLECLQGPETHPVPFRLGGRRWRVDASLHFDLVLALMEFEKHIDRHRLALDYDLPNMAADQRHD